MEGSSSCIQLHDAKLLSVLLIYPSPQSFCGCRWVLAIYAKILRVINWIVVQAAVFANITIGIASGSLVSDNSYFARN
jgi:hypothetical protein